MEGQLTEIIREKILDAERAPLPDFTRRDIRVPAVPRKAVAVIGMRRTGKTTFLWQVAADRLAAGTPREGILYFSFDDERLLDLEARQLGLVTDTYYRLHPEWRRRQALVLLDEIQLVPGWERFARRLLDSENVALYLSGSSAQMLSREVASSMRGRAVEAVVHPFSFREFLRHRGQEPAALDRVGSAERSALEAALERYLEIGGFPEVQALDARDRATVLRGYVDAVLLRDVIERHAVSQPVALRHLVHHLLAHAAGPFSVNRFHRDLRARGFRIGKDLLHAYLEHLADAFLVHPLWLADESVRRRMTNPRKVYPADPALIPLYDRSGRVQPGKALETLACIDLLRRGADVGYVRTREGLEVDFLARWPEGGSVLVQACADASDPDTFAREVRALEAARREHPDAEAVLVCIVGPALGLEHPPWLRVEPAWRWLLREAS